MNESGRQPAGLLVLPRLKVQNANAISSPLTWGFPPPSAFLGFAHALERRLSARHEHLAVRKQRRRGKSASRVHWSDCRPIPVCAARGIKHFRIGGNAVPALPTRNQHIPVRE